MSEYVYPKRPPAFVIKFIRELSERNVPQTMGTLAFTLLVTIADEEDRHFCKGPAVFHNHELQKRIGGVKSETLSGVRQRVISAGWLVHIPPQKGSRRPGRYWVQIPPIDVIPTDDRNQNRTSDNTRRTGIERGNETDDRVSDGTRSTDIERGIEPGIERQPDYILLPNPKPKRESRSDSRPSLDELIAKWNKIPGIIHCRSSTPRRQTAYNARCRDASWLAEVDAALERIAASAFCRGESDRGWKADIDWFLKPDSLTKILEGKYDDQPKQSANPKAESIYKKYPLFTDE